MIAITVQGDKIVIDNLGALAASVPQVLKRGIKRIVRGVHREAYAWLSGAGSMASSVGSGGYPVPVRTGHLRRSLDFLDPGQTRTAGGKSWSTGELEGMVYDSAIYSIAIHEGRGSSAKFGPRAFITDGVKTFDSQTGLAKVLEEEMGKEMEKMQ